jgi:hypothetical protein
MALWPSQIPLLLSAFRVVDAGVIWQRNTLVRRRCRCAARLAIRAARILLGRGRAAASFPNLHPAIPAPPQPQVRVADVPALVAALNRLPRGTEASPEVPALQPVYAGPPPGPDAKGFTIKSWQVGRPRQGPGDGSRARPALGA